MNTSKKLLLAGALVAAGAACSKMKGSGAGGFSDTPPPTKSAGMDAERAYLPARELDYGDYRRGVLGAPGAARDSAGGSRLGARTERAAKPAYGESAQGQGPGEVSEAWKSGDAVRSWSSADVRQSRQQEAPEVEVARAGAVGGASASAPAAPHEARAPGAQAAPAAEATKGKKAKR